MMAERRVYEMSEEQHKALLAEFVSDPVIYGSGGMRLYRTAQEKANAAWERLAQEMGFDPMTVRPVQGRGERVFSAEPREGR